MGFAKGAEKKLMSMFIDMYSDPQLAILREYSNNAWDSHVAAGETRPIEVSLPSPLTPYLTVTDFGVGLSVDDVHSLYSKYGASTKDTSNDATGFMGIGSKAALTYTNQFTVVATKNGVRVTVAVTRDEDGAGNMLIVDTARSTTPNGVEVRIPIRAGDNLTPKAQDFFAYWPPGTVLLNGKPPAHVGGLIVTQAGKDGEKFTLRLIEQGRDKSRIVMGNVPYPTDKLGNYELNLPYGYSIVAEVPIGAVSVAPSREALAYDRETLAVIEQIKTSFKRGLYKAVQAKIEEAPTRLEAVKAINSWSKVLGTSARQFRFKGHAIPDQLVRPVGGSYSTDDPTKPRLLLTSAGMRRLSSCSNVGSLDLSYFTQTVFVKDYTLTKLTPTHKKKLLMWVEQHKLTTNNFVLVNFPLGDVQEWIEPARITTWDEINKLKLPKVTPTNLGGSGRIPGSFDLMVKPDADSTARYRHGVPGDDIDQKNPVYWTHGNHHDGVNIAGMLAQLSDAFTLVLLPENRIAKFKRDNPQIAKADTAFQAAYDKWWGTLSDNAKLALAIDNTGDWQELSSLLIHADKMLDPALKKAVLATKGIDVRTLRNQDRRWTGHVKSKVPDAFVNPIDSYPLCTYSDIRYNPDATIEYLNAVYVFRNA